MGLEQSRTLYDLILLSVICRLNLQCFCIPFTDVRLKYAAIYLLVQHNLCWHQIIKHKLLISIGYIRDRTIFKRSPLLYTAGALPGMKLIIKKNYLAMTGKALRQNEWRGSNAICSQGIWSTFQIFREYLKLRFKELCFQETNQTMSQLTMSRN